MMKKIIITIDGFSSCGKSTLAKQLAAKLNYVFVDSGAMYRAITLYFINNHIALDNEPEINAALVKINLQFAYNAATGKSDMLLNGVNVENEIRTMEVSDKVSDVAALKEVREFAVAQQQQMGVEKGIVMDGRDIGTTVFPNAELKIFVTADPSIRVERRYKELYEKGELVAMEDVKNNLEMRDYIDSNREFSPLKKATDAIVLDNTKLTREDQLEMVIHWVNEKIQGN
jgi:CMP/dCMP kinase